MAEVTETVEQRGDVGAIIVESAGASRANCLCLAFLHELQAFCREREIVFIMDEVVTGFRWAPGGVQRSKG